MEERMGDFLIHIGAMTEGQVASVLALQAGSMRGKLFGQIALELEFVDEAAIQRYLLSREPE